MNSEFLVKFLEERRTPIVKKKYHSYLSYRGIKEDYIYILKEGVVKTSVIMRDGREFNFSYLKAIDIVSLSLYSWIPHHESKRQCQWLLDRKS